MANFYRFEISKLSHYDCTVRKFTPFLKNDPLKVNSNESQFDLSGNMDDDSTEVEKLKNEVRNYEMRAQHQKLAMTNLEKSISTYHDKLEAIEGANIEYRTKLSTSEETIERLNNEIAARNNKINQLEDVMRQSKQDVNHTNSFS